MRSINYTLEILNQNDLFEPNKQIIDRICSSKSRVFEIRAANGYGKTFLLDLIAYASGLHRKQDTSLDKNLRTLSQLKDRIKRFDDVEDYRLSYEIQLNLEDEDSLTFSKESSETSKSSKYRIGSQLYGVETLHTQLDVLYDIPTSPTERLNSIVKDLSDWNHEFTLKASVLKRKLLDISQRFREERDEEVIEREENAILEQKITKETTEKEINKLDATLRILKKKEILIKHRDLEKQLDVISLNYESCISRLDEIGDSPNELFQNELELQRKQKALTRNINDWIEFGRDLLDQVTKIEQVHTLIESEKALTNYVDTLIKGEYPEDIRLFSDSTEYFLANISQALDKLEDESDNQIYKVLIELNAQLEQLEKLKRKDVLQKLTTVKFEDIKAQLEILIEEANIVDFKPVRDTLGEFRTGYKSYLRRIKESKSDLEKEIAKETGDKHAVERSSLKIDKSRLSQDRERINKDIQNCESLLLKNHNLDWKGMSSSKKHSLFEEFSRQLGVEARKDSSMLQAEIDSKERELKEIEEKIGLSRARILQEKGKEKKQYSEEQKQNLKDFQKQLGLIERNLSEFSSFLLDSDIEAKKLTSQDELFLDVIGIQIAESMNKELLLRDQKYAQLSSYNLASQKFHMQDGTVVRKEDLSAGLSSANYLKQRIRNLKANYVIILLDEIGNMDDNTLKEVVIEINKLKEQKRLVLALLTKPKPEGVELIEY